MKNSLSAYVATIGILLFTSTSFAQGTKPAADPEKWLQALPKLEALESAALQYNGMSPGKLSRWERNARRAAALPHLQVGYDQKAQQQNTGIVQDSISVTSSGVTVGPEANRVDQNFGNNRGFEVKAVWALDELLFNRDELEVSREARDLLVFRGRLQEELRQTYYDLKAAFLNFELQPESAQDPFQILKAQQSMDKLDSLSGGEFYRLYPLRQLPIPEISTPTPKEKSHANISRPNPQRPAPDAATRTDLPERVLW